MYKNVIKHSEIDIQERIASHSNLKITVANDRCQVHEDDFKNE